jgi:hypothetical protein
VAEQFSDLDDLARGLLEIIPSAARIQVWADGKTFMDPPDAEARPPKPEPAATPNDLIIDLATAIMLTQAEQAANTQTGPPPWLTRHRACVPTRDVLRGRATGKTPPV